MHACAKGQPDDESFYSYFPVSSTGVLQPSLLKREMRRERLGNKKKKQNWNEDRDVEGVSPNTGHTELSLGFLA